MTLLVGLRKLRCIDLEGLLSVGDVVDAQKRFASIRRGAEEEEDGKVGGEDPFVSHWGGRLGGRRAWGCDDHLGSQGVGEQQLQVAHARWAGVQLRPSEYRISLRRLSPAL